MEPWMATLLWALWGMYPLACHWLHLFNMFKYVLTEFNQLFNSLTKEINLDQKATFLKVKKRKHRCIPYCKCTPSCKINGTSFCLGLFFLFFFFFFKCLFYKATSFSMLNPWGHWKTCHNVFNTTKFYHSGQEYVRGFGTLQPWFMASALHEMPHLPDGIACLKPSDHASLLPVPASLQHEWTHAHICVSPRRLV